MDIHSELNSTIKAIDNAKKRLEIANKASASSGDFTEPMAIEDEIARLSRQAQKQGNIAGRQTALNEDRRKNAAIAARNTACDSATPAAIVKGAQRVVALADELAAAIGSITAEIAVDRANIVGLAMDASPDRLKAADSIPPLPEFDRAFLAKLVGRGVIRPDLLSFGTSPETRGADLAALILDYCDRIRRIARQQPVHSVAG